MTNEITSHAFKAAKSQYGCHCITVGIVEGLSVIQN